MTKQLLKNLKKDVTMLRSFAIEHFCHLQLALGKRVSKADLFDWACAFQHRTPQQQANLLSLFFFEFYNYKHCRRKPKEEVIQHWLESIYEKQPTLLIS